MENKELWYAVMMDNNDNDWGTGSRNLEEAKKMVEDLKENGFEDAYTAVIDESGNDPMCIEEIR